MKPSQEYLQLKAGKTINKPFKVKLSRELAIELLIRASNCRPVNSVYAMAFAFEFLGRTFEVNNGDPIGIVYDSDNLYSGVQRLAGLILSGLKAQEMWVMFVGAEAFMSHQNLSPIPKPIP